MSENESEGKAQKPPITIHDGTISVSTATVTSILATLVSGAVATGSVSFMIKTDPEVLSAIEAAEDRIEVLEDQRERDARKTALILAIMKKAHKVSITGVEGDVDPELLPDFP